MPTTSRPLALTVLLASTFIQLLDTTIVNVAAPAIGADLDAGSGRLVLVSAVYTAALAATLLPAGRFGHRHGPRRVFAVGVALFTLASAGCGLAPTVDVLIGMRLVQGIGAGVMVPQALFAISALWQGPAHRRALGWYGATMGLASVLGPVLGALLSESDVAGIGWRAIFAVNVPVGAAVLLALPRCVPVLARDPEQRVGWSTAAGLAAGVLGLVLAISLARTVGGVLPWLCGAIGAAVVVCALVLQGRNGRPVTLPLGLWRGPRFRAGSATAAAFFLAVTPFFFLFSQWLQTVRGLSPLRAGLLQIPWAVGAIAGSTLAGRRARSPRHSVYAAALVAASLLVVAVLLPRVPPIALSPALFAAGIGYGAFVARVFADTLDGIRPDLRGAASGALPAIQQLSGSLGLSCAGLVFFPAGRLAGTVYAYSLPLLCLAVLASLALVRTHTRTESVLV
ncbi:MFS transporter [Streptomyces griseofuscus]|uniref:MFS transporter n=1 Tax=Streptomyces griseofuscus TaxID=146922 RepID=UPI00380CD0DF